MLFLSSIKVYLTYLIVLAKKQGILKSQNRFYEVNRQQSVPTEKTEVRRQEKQGRKRKDGREREALRWRWCSEYLCRIHTEQKNSEGNTAPHTLADTHTAMFTTDYTIVPNSLTSIIPPALHRCYCCTCRLLIMGWKTEGVLATSTAERGKKRGIAMPLPRRIISGNYCKRPKSATRLVESRGCPALISVAANCPASERWLVSK